MEMNPSLGNVLNFQDKSSCSNLHKNHVIKNPNFCLSPQAPFLQRYRFGLKIPEESNLTQDM